MHVEDFTFFEDISNGVDTVFPHQQIRMYVSEAEGICHGTWSVHYGGRMAGSCDVAGSVAAGGTGVSECSGVSNLGDSSEHRSKW